MRSGVIAKKIGMTRVFLEDGKQIPVTVLQMENLQVVSQRTNETDGYTAVQLGAGVAKVKRQSAAMRGHFAKAKVEPKRKIAEFRVSADNLIEVGEEIIATHFLGGQKVDVSGTSIGKGFAGAMKRHTLKAYVPATVFRFHTVRMVPRDSVKSLVKCLKAKRWPVTWVRLVLLRKTWKLLVLMLIVV